MISTSHNIAIVRNQGTVLISIILIILILSVIVLSTASTVMTNQRVVANTYREMNAFEAAEAGLEYGFIYAQDHFDAIIADNDNNGVISSPTLAPAGTRYQITYTNPIVGNFNYIEITSQGTSSDGIGSETVRQMLYRTNFLPYNLPSGLTALGNVSLSGNVGISNPNKTAIWSGGEVTIKGSVQVDGAIKKNDTNLSVLTGDGFFYNFFNKSKSATKNSVDIAFQNTSNTNYSGNYASTTNGLNGVTGKSIFITQAPGTTATINSNAIIGSPDNPVALIVQGNLNLSGSATIYGVVYVIGDWTASGTMKIHGAAIVEGNATSTGTADLDFSKDQQNMNKIINLVKVIGSWRDF